MSSQICKWKKYTYIVELGQVEFRIAKVWVMKMNEQLVRMVQIYDKSLVWMDQYLDLTFCLLLCYIEQYYTFQWLLLYFSACYITHRAQLYGVIFMDDIIITILQAILSYTSPCQVNNMIAIQYYQSLSEHKASYRLINYKVLHLIL